MKSAKEIKHVLISLYCRTFGGDQDVLEVWDGSSDDFIVMRKEDGWITTISRADVDGYLSNHKPTREGGKEELIKAFHRFEESPEE